MLLEYKVFFFNKAGYLTRDYSGLQKEHNLQIENLLKLKQKINILNLGT